MNLTGVEAGSGKHCAGCQMLQAYGQCRSILGNGIQTRFVSQMMKWWNVIAHNIFNIHCSILLIGDGKFGVDICMFTSPGVLPRRLYPGKTKEKVVLKSWKGRLSPVSKWVFFDAVPALAVDHEPALNLDYHSSAWIHSYLPGFISSINNQD